MPKKIYWIIFGAVCWNLFVYWDDLFPEPDPTTPDTITEFGFGENPDPGQEWKENGPEIVFLWCPPGEFRMGSPDEEPGAYDNEEQVNVRLTQGFWLAKFEVTQEQFTKVMDMAPSGFAKDGEYEIDVEGLDTSRFPVDSVSWYQADRFCSELTKQEREAGRLPEGWRYDLPTEAQWEYAARAGAKTATAFGEQLSSTQANFNGESPYNDAEVGPDMMRPCLVGNYPANEWGFHDIHGNVSEWCQDRYEEELPGGANPHIWADRKDRKDRVCRGGSWGDDGVDCRFACRGGYPFDEEYSDVGLRIAIVPSE